MYQHVVEELSTNQLASIADEAGVSDTIDRLTLHMPEHGEGAVLETDCHDLVDRGIDPDRLLFGNGTISDAFISGYATNADSDDPAVVYEIGEAHRGQQGPETVSFGHLWWMANSNGPIRLSL